MTITRETVLHVARLARLELAEEEISRMREDLGNILSHVEELAKLSTEGVPETAHVATAGAPLRPDTPIPSLEPSLALAEAPRKTAGSFAVPGFVDE